MPKINESNGKCQWCNIELEDENYRYCTNRLHSYLHYEIKQKMNHQFIASSENKMLCAFQAQHNGIISGSVCGRTYLDHTAAARCESCLKCGICNIVDGLLLCDACAEHIKTNHFNLIEESRNIDRSIRSNQDFFNAKTIALRDLRAAIDNDASISNKDEAFKAEILTRYEHFSTHLFELDNERYQVQLEKAVVKKSLDELAASLRADERERIKIADANYVPPARSKPVKPRVAKQEKLSVFEQMIKTYASMHGITETEARITLQKGLKAQGIETDK